MRILSLETCFKYCSAALLVDGELFSFETLLEKNRQAEMLLEQVDKCLKSSEMPLDQIDVIAVTRGPGSFTGVRIGLAAAHGLKYGVKEGGALDDAIYSISTLALLWYLNGKNDCVIALKAGRGRFYVQRFLGALPECLDHSRPEIIEEEGLSEYVGGLPVFGDLSDGFQAPTAADVALAAYDFMENGVKPAEAMPLYIGLPDAYGK